MISVVIPTFNESENLPRFFDSLSKSRLDDYEIIIVDSESQDKTLEIAKTWGSRIISQPRKGVGAARNAGLKAARGQIVASLDADSIVCRGWLDRVAKDFELHKGIVALGGPSSYGHPIYDTWSFFTQWQNNFTPFTGFAYFGANNSAYDTAYLRKTGGWSEKLDEEMELSLRLFYKRAPLFFDWNLSVRLSDRRFRELGFWNTIAGWSAGSVEAAIGIKRERSDYASWRKK